MCRNLCLYFRATHVGIRAFARDTLPVSGVMLDFSFQQRDLTLGMRCIKL